MVTNKYRLLIEQCESLIDGVDYLISNMANISALLWEEIKDINWVGFYILKDDVLCLGPFQGKVACTKIEIGKGVCGSAVKRDETILVENVHDFPGHIACDSQSNSEIVIPIHHNGKIIGVLDIDSPIIGRFSSEDRIGLDNIVKVFEKSLK